jgi:glutaminyl-peptide cyclotransferase
MRYIFIVMMISAAISCGSTNGPTNNGNSNTVKSTPVPIYTYEIVKTYPHDISAYTQGLVLHNGFFYEGTGGYGHDSFKSSLRKVEVETGKVLQKHDLAPEYFGEGITILGDKIFQLTWKEGKAFVYSLSDFRLLQEFDYAGQGWGLTHDGTNLYLSDGTHVIRVVDPVTFKTIRTIVALDENSRPIMQLNELEWVKGEIWANVYETGWIVRIDPQTGKLLGRIDLNSMADDEEKQNQKANVLNGIAYDEANDRLFVTGKLWRRLFEIKIKPKA